MENKTETLKKTKTALKATGDGIMAYWVYYFATSAIIYFALKGMTGNVFNFTFWQCFWAVVLFRQIKGLIVRTGNNHWGMKEKKYTKEEMNGIAKWALLKMIDSAPADITFEKWEAEQNGGQ